MKKRITAVLLAASVVASAMVSCGTAYAAEAKTQPSGETAQSLPAKIDLRDYNGKNYVTPVKKQSPFATCWAFGIAAAAETAYLYANDLGVPAGEKNTNVDFSEKYIAWFLYHGITAADVTKGKIRASQIGEGTDMEQIDKEYAAAAYSFGGAGSNGLNFFASGFGPVDESVSINGELPYYYAGKNWLRSDTESAYSAYDNWTIPVNTTYRNPLSTQGFKGGKILPSPCSWDQDGRYVFDEDALNVVKSEIAKGHAIAVSACFGSNMNPDNWAMFNNGSNYLPNHEVTIVGYDDNYSRDNFTRYYQSGKVGKNTTPPGDGAFIVKNTNGSLTEEDKATAVKNKMGVTIYEDPNAGKWGIDDSGYFYLSYYDHSIDDLMCFDFESEAAVKYKEKNHDQYDLLMTTFYAGSEYDTVSKMANVFDAEEDEYLYSISYRTNAPSMTAAYEIYKDVQDGDPASGTLLETGETTHALSGYYNIDLKGEYLLKKGEKYSVVMTMSRPSADGERTVYSDVVPFATNIDVGGGHTSVINTVMNPGESYFSTGGAWTDMTELREALIDKAYQQSLAYTRGQKQLIDMNPDGRDGFKVDNYPIKALLVPADKHGAETTVGDVNGDGRLTIDDATEMQKYLAQIVEFSDAQMAAADTDGDGIVTINDVTHLQKYLAQYHVTLGKQPSA